MNVEPVFHLFDDRLAPALPEVEVLLGAEDTLFDGIVFDDVELVDQTQELIGGRSVLSAVEELAPGVGQASAAFPTAVIAG